MLFFLLQWSNKMVPALSRLSAALLWLTGKDEFLRRQENQILVQFSEEAVCVCSDWDLAVSSLSVSTGLALSSKVNQSPTELLRDSGGSIQLNCSHAIPNYDTILWYHQAVGTRALILMGYLFYENPNIETSYNGHCSLSGDGRVSASLRIPKVKSADSGMYFCAARYAQCLQVPFLL